MIILGVKFDLFTFAYLALLLSNGIKEARDTMSHEGYKHSVSKQDLKRILDEIIELERTLYPEAN